MTQRVDLKSELNKAITAIESGDSFSHFFMGLTKEEKNNFQFLNVHKGDYHNFGSLQTLNSDIVKFFTEQENDSEQCQYAANIIENFSQQICNAFESDSAWILLKTSVPTDEYDVPRWHQDGSYFTTDEAQKKVLVSLKGADSRLADISAVKNTHVFNYFANGYDSNNDDHRVGMAGLIDERVEIITPDNSGSIITVGEENGAVHSEPPIHIDRIFMSVLPGTQEQIEELRCKWGFSPTCFNI